MTESARFGASGFEAFSAGLPAAAGGALTTGVFFSAAPGLAAFLDFGEGLGGFNGLVFLSLPDWAAAVFFEVDRIKLFFPMSTPLNS